MLNDFSYNPDTGTITRLVQHGNYKAGTKCTSPTSNGYLKVTLRGKVYLAHRLAWELHTGMIPPEQIDHVNLDGTDNRWINLRAADSSTNQMNIEVHKRSSTSIKGIMLVRGGTMYRAEVCKNGIKHQKHSKCLETVTAWLLAKRNELHGQFARNS